MFSIFKLLFEQSALSVSSSLECAQLCASDTEQAWVITAGPKSASKKGHSEQR